MALLALRQGSLECQRVINPDSLLEAIIGPVRTTTIDAVRGALISGAYVVTAHDPEDWAFRDAEQLSLESVVALLTAREQ